MFFRFWMLTSFDYARDGIAQGCDVLAKNDRGHTPFALCTDPEASSRFHPKWSVRFCCRDVLPVLSFSYSFLLFFTCNIAVLNIDRDIWQFSFDSEQADFVNKFVSLLSGPAALAECYECNSLQGLFEEYVFMCFPLVSETVKQSPEDRSNRGVWKTVLLHSAEISLLMVGAFTTIKKHATCHLVFSAAYFHSAL